MPNTWTNIYSCSSALCTWDSSQLGQNVIWICVLSLLGLDRKLHHLGWQAPGYVSRECVMQGTATKVPLQSGPLLSCWQILFMFICYVSFTWPLIQFILLVSWYIACILHNAYTVHACNISSLLTSFAFFPPLTLTFLCDIVPLFHIIVPSFRLSMLHTCSMLCEMFITTDCH